jgi:hypothetical protein
MPSFFNRVPGRRSAAAPQQPGQPVEPRPGHTPATLAGPPGLPRRDRNTSHSSPPPRQPSPYAIGMMSTPAQSQAAPAPGWRLPSFSPPGAKSYPIALNAQIAGFALVNVASSGPAKPTTADVRPKHCAESLRVAIPDTGPKRAELALEHAARATRAADAATQPDAAPAVRKKKGVLRSAKRLLSKAKTQMGIGAPSAPTVNDVLQVGQSRQDGPPPPTSAKQARQLELQRTVVDGLGATYHARAGRAALAAVEALHAQEEQASERLVGNYVDLFSTLLRGYHHADDALQKAGAKVETQKTALDDARRHRDHLSAQHADVAASLPQLQAEQAHCEQELLAAQQALEQARSKAGTVPELEQKLALARSAHQELQHWAADIEKRQQEIRPYAGPSLQASLLAREKAECHFGLDASAKRRLQLHVSLHAARQAKLQAVPEGEAKVASLEPHAERAAARLAKATQALIPLGQAEHKVQLFQCFAEIAQRELDAAQKNLDAASQALKRHQQTLGGVETAIRPGGVIEHALATAREAQTRLKGRKQDILQHLKDTQETASKAAVESMQRMRMNPPGFAGAALTDGPLHDTLATLETRLSAIPQEKGKLAADEIVELAIKSAALSSGGDPAVAAQALQALGTITLADLARTGPLQELDAGVQSHTAALAQMVSRKPRGMEILGALVMPSQPALAPAHVRAVQTYLAAAAELARIEPSDKAAHQWLTAAQAVASQIVQGTRADQVPDAQRAAFHGVRNGFMTNGPGSDYEKTDTFMRSVSGEMLKRALAAKPQPGPWGRIKAGVTHLLPIHQPTPFNRAALEAASRTANAVGIVVSPEVGLAKLFTALEPLRPEPGSSAGLPVIEQALLAFADALRTRAATQPPLSLTLDDPLIEAVDTLLGAATPHVREAWDLIKDAQPRPHPLEALRTLLDLAKSEAVAPNPALAGLGRALDLARGSFFMANPRIETTQDIVDYCQAIIPNLKLRDKIKITGGGVLGATTAGLGVITQAGHPGVSSVGRVDLRKSEQNDQVLDLVMSQQAFQLTIGTQTTKVDRGGVGGGVGFKVPGAVTIRPLDLDWKTTREVQSQDGVLLRVQRNKKTERDDLAKFQAMVTDVIKWSDLKPDDKEQFSGPLEVVLARHPAVSVNLLAEYDRQALKRDSTAGAVFAVGIPGARVTGSLFSVGAKNQVMATRAKEATGHFQFQERKKNVVAATQVGGGVGLSIPLLGAVSGNTGLTANGARLAEVADVRTRGIEITVRLTTEDNVATQSRLITEYLRADDFEKAIRDNWKTWVTHGVAFNTSYPADFSDVEKHVAAEKELVDFLAEVKKKENEFMTLSQVTAMRPEVAPRVDALRGLIELARQAGDEAELATQEHRLDELLAEPSTWTVRRLVVNERANRTEQQGLSLLAIAQVSSVADASHNALLYPRG